MVAQRAATGDFKNYQEWLYASFRKTFTETFPMEYTVKHHTTTADNMSTDGPTAVLRPTLDEVLRGALGPNTSLTHYVDFFRYPTRGGLTHTFSPSPATLRSRQATRSRRWTTCADNSGFANGRQADYDHLVSSIPRVIDYLALCALMRGISSLSDVRWSAGTRWPACSRAARVRSSRIRQVPDTPRLATLIPSPARIRRLASAPPR